MDSGKFKLKKKIDIKLLLLSILVIMNGMSCLKIAPSEFKNIMNDIFNKQYFQIQIFVFLCLNLCNKLDKIDIKYFCFYVWSSLDIMNYCVHELLYVLGANGIRATFCLRTKWCYELEQ